MIDGDDKKKKTSSRKTSSAKTAEAQVAAFAPIGEEMEYLTDAGKGTLLAMAGSQKLIQDEVETEEEITFEYEEKDL